METDSTWPNFFIVGAQRAGTTSLYEYLKKIPGIYMSPIRDPEYFTGDNASIIGTDCEKTRKYLKLFRNAKTETIIGEASAAYLTFPGSPKLIHNVVPDAKILISLRNPVDRFISHYTMRKTVISITPFHQFVTNPPDLKSKEGFTELFEVGLYSKQIDRYWNQFGKNNVKIIIFEEFTRDIPSVLKEILEFLNLDTKVANEEYTIYNSSFTAKGNWIKPIMRSIVLKKIALKILGNQRRIENLKQKYLKKSKSLDVFPKDKKILEELYREDVIRVKELLERNLPW